MPRRRPAAPAPLLAWPELQRLGDLARRHQALTTRMHRMPPRSRRRLHAESEIAALTRQMLTLEMQMRRDVP
ncbi:hypothetical protein [Ancylobacter pratisalsi]|uniref:Uncharacterized protein n=1 Tax=Ancylobacter pratisalsi TaxID=1745854 RepID=A0A6P1YPD4_9HYPH|nr:hypothetical protein [Ancylobacter pratisalsi]QIB34770.1 hypothetical protein G3A50_14425 [Ancylobacter pratisalsi]